MILKQWADSPKEEAKMKALKIASALLAGVAISAGVILKSRVQTMHSLRHIGGKLYKINYKANYNLDKLLATGVKDVAGLTSFVSKELFFGYPIEVNEQICGCTSFACESPTGELLVGRNFDYPKTGVLLVETKPKNGYASRAMMCLEHLGISVEEGTTPETFMGKAMALAAPYACVDGINEKGLHVSVLELQSTPTAQNRGKPPIITTVAVRMLLDKCASVEEAVAMLAEYDMYSSAGSPYHFLIADAAGNTVVVEWPDPEQEMVVLNHSYVTNFQLAEGKDKGKGGGDDRYGIVEEALKKSGGVLSQEEVMATLADAGVPWNGYWCTNWSVVYNLRDFGMRICCDMEFDTVYEV